MAEVLLGPEHDLYNVSSITNTTSNRDQRGERKRYQILGALIECGGKAKTSEIREALNPAEMSGDLLRYHCRILENKRDPSMVESAGREKADQKHLMPENVYRITDHGRESYEEAGDDKLSLEEAETFAELRAEVAELQERVEELEEEQDDRLNTLEDWVADISTAQDDLASRFKELDSQR